MSSRWGRQFSISLFGESHGGAVGVVIDSPPPGVALDMDKVAAFLARRAPGNSPLATTRREDDMPLIQSGIVNGRTTGTPLCAIIPNTDARPADYGEARNNARPGHADYTGYLRYGGYGDHRGGGHFSARLTAPLVFAGAVAMQALELCGVTIGGHIAAIHGIQDTPFDPVNVTLAQLKKVGAKPFPVIDDRQGEKMIAEIDAARLASDSVGGLVECCAVGLPAGVGSPIFDGMENAIASLIFGIPAVKGVEFGAGFAVASLLGSENNDPMVINQDGSVAHTANNHGGILGGVSSGMPIIVRAAFKPTPSIPLRQQTVDFIAGQNTVIEILGRHDPCVVPRAVPCVEACVAIALLDMAQCERGVKPWI